MTPPMTIDGHTLKNDLFLLAGRVGFVESLYLTPEMFGAKGDGVTDDTAALQAAFNALPAGGGTILARGLYKCLGGLNFTGKPSFNLQGIGGRNGNANTASEIIYSGPNAARFMDIRSNQGTGIRDISIQHTANFTGFLVDSGSTGSDPGYLKIENCVLSGAAGFQTSTLLNLDKCIVSRIESTNFFFAAKGIQGKASQASYANQISVVDCTFNVVAAIWNLGQSWVIQSCASEHDPGLFIGHDAGVSCDACVVSGCWLGDDTLGGTQITMIGNDLTVVGNLIQTTGGTAVFIDETTVGLAITGNRFETGLNGVKITANSGNTNWIITGNRYVGTTNKISGLLPGHCMYGDPRGDAAGDPVQMFANPKNIPTIMVGNDDTVAAYGANDQAGGIRFQGKGVAHFDVGYYPNDTTLGKIRFSSTGGNIAPTPVDTVGIGTLILQQGAKVKEGGAAARMGTAVLVGGTVVVNTTAVTANSRIFLTIQTPNGTVGSVYVSARVAGTSFTITSVSVIDTSTVAWMIVEPA